MAIRMLMPVRTIQNLVLSCRVVLNVTILGPTYLVHGSGFAPSIAIIPVAFKYCMEYYGASDSFLDCNIYTAWQQQLDVASPEPYSSITAEHAQRSRYFAPFFLL